VSAVNRGDPEDKRAEASHPTDPVKTPAPRATSDELVEGETLDVGDDPAREGEENRR